MVLKGAMADRHAKVAIWVYGRAYIDDKKWQNGSVYASLNFPRSGY